MQVLKEDGRPATSKSIMWVRRGGPPRQRIILFDYAPTRAGRVPLQILDDHKEYLQSDADAAYDKPGRRDGVRHVGCLDHARRNFVEAVKAQHAVAGAEHGLAPEALLIIRKIYGIEKLMRDAKMSADQRHTLRAETARPIQDELRAWLDRNLGAASPQSYTAKAMNYLAAEWPRLIRYLEDGRSKQATCFARMQSARSSSEERPGSSLTRRPARTPRHGFTASSRRRRHVDLSPTRTCVTSSGDCRGLPHSPTSRRCCPGASQNRRSSVAPPPSANRQAKFDRSASGRS